MARSDGTMHWIHTGKSRFRLELSSEEAAAYVEGILDGEVVVTQGHEREEGTDSSPSANCQNGNIATDPTRDSPDYEFRTTPPGGCFATRYTWTVAADTDGDQKAIVEQCRETTLGTVLLLLLPAVLAAAVGTALFTGMEPVDGLPRGMWAVTNGPLWMSTIGFVAAMLGLVGAAGIYQWRLRRPILFAPLAGVVLIPIIGILVDDTTRGILLAADGLPAQPWIIAVPLLAGGVVPFALVRSFYRPCPGGLLAEHGVASVSRRGESLPLGIGLVVTVAVTPAILVLPVSAGLSFAGTLPRVVGGWMVVVAALLCVVVVVESLG